MENGEVVDHIPKFVITCFIVHLHNNMGKKDVDFKEKDFITHVMLGNLLLFFLII
jgi:hypothetical protein